MKVLEIDCNIPAFLFQMFYFFSKFSRNSSQNYLKTRTLWVTFVQIEFLVTKYSFVYFEFVQFECRILRSRDCCTLSSRPTYISLLSASVSLLALLHLCHFGDSPFVKIRFSRTINWSNDIFDWIRPCMTLASILNPFFDLDLNFDLGQFWTHFHFLTLTSILTSVQIVNFV